MLKAEKNNWTDFFVDKSTFENSNISTEYQHSNKKEKKAFLAGRSGCIRLWKRRSLSLHLSCAALAAPCRMSCSLCSSLSAECGANIRAASPAGRPNHSLEAGLIGLTYSIKLDIKPPLTVHWGLTASDAADAAFSLKDTNKDQSRFILHVQS